MCPQQCVLVYRGLKECKSKKQPAFVKKGMVIARRGGGGTPLFGLYGDVPLDRVWFFGLAVLNRVYNLTCLCPKQGKNLS